jgi:predicted site-specific integrase-resolvase
LAQGGWEVASSTVYHWTEAGLVRFARVGMGRGRLRIYPDQVEVMLARHRRAELLQAIAPTSQVG